MQFQVSKISKEQISKIVLAQEGQFSDVKAIEITPAKLTNTISAFANTDGGDVFVGIDEIGEEKKRQWRGFADVEAANAHIQTCEMLFPAGAEFNYEFLVCDEFPGHVLHIQVNKAKGIKNSSSGVPYIRRAAQNLPANSPEMHKRLEYLKGISSFESEPVNAPKEIIVSSKMLQDFIKEVVPKAEPEGWLRKQMFLIGDRPSVAGALLFAEEPQAVLPKRCGIKVYQYKTSEEEGMRDEMVFDPKTVEGCIYDQIKAAVGLTTEIIESIPKLGDDALEKIKYPNETLHEIITNAVIHRDYSIADDVHIRVFENRIEVQSPGRLPAHITPANILTERAARNGAIVRILNKFKDAPNKDVGEGLNTAFEAMHSLGLKEPIISERGNSVLVTIKHETLASPEEAIMTYLEKHDTIRNATARKVAHVRADYQMKSIFGRMVEKGMIEQVPGTRTSSTAYQKKQGPTQRQTEML
jgi:ATP-dependent DNA helicase RecG